MSILDRLKPQPRWKHTDPAIRLDAVREVDDAIDLAALAEADPDARVRRAAVERLDDVEGLGRIVAGDPDGDTRERAADRLVALACQVASPAARVAEEEAATPVDRVALSLSAIAALDDQRRLALVARSEAPDVVRDAALARLTETRVLGSVARHATSEATAAAALTRLEDPIELLEVALNGDHRDVALEAFERAAAPLDLAQLRSVEVRARQKTVSRRARVLIQEIEQAEAERHAAALERQRREGMLYDAVVQVADVADLDVARRDLEQLTESWKALSVTEPAASNRFASAVRTAEAAIARRQREADEALELQRTRLEAIATRETLCARVETLDADDALEQLIPIEEEWRSLLPLVGNGPEADRLAERFALAVAACRKRHEMSAVLADARVKLDALVTEAETLGSLEDSGAAASRWQALSREARGFTAILAEAGGSADALEARLSAVGEVFAARHTAEREAAEESRRAVVLHLQRLIDRARRVADAESVTLREGDRLMRDIVAGFEKAAEAGSSKALDEVTRELGSLREVVAPRVRELRELDDWRRFANGQRQEQLIGMAEAIVGSLRADEEAGRESDLPATARALRELNAEWQKVAEGPLQRSRRLWDRFRTATDFIRARCEVHFRQLRAERKASSERKAAILAEAEGLVESTDWAPTAARLQALQHEWRDLPRAGREAERELGQRFRTACSAFFSRRREDLSDRKKVWSENLARKEALCARAEDLATSTDWDVAAAEVKKLQAEWKTLGPVRKSRSEAVWKRFHTAADQFFERYHSRHEIALTEKLMAREAVVAELEALAATVADPPADFAEQVQAARTKWQQGAPVPVPGMKPLNTRWRRALGTVLSSRPEAFAGTDLDPAAVVQRMEKLVNRVEGVMEGLDDTPAPELSQTELLAARLRSAFATNAMGSRSAQPSRRRGALDAVRDAQGTWQRLPPLDSQEVKALEIRFREACRRIHETAGEQRPGQSLGARPPSKPRQAPREPAAV